MYFYESASITSEIRFEIQKIQMLGRQATVD